jgi:hypothetical protein
VMIATLPSRRNFSRYIRVPCQFVSVTGSMANRKQFADLEIAVTHPVVIVSALRHPMKLANLNRERDCFKALCGLFPFTVRFSKNDFAGLIVIH